MGRGRITPDETIERIKATYAFNGSLKQTSIDLGVPIATVSKYVNQEVKDEFESVRIENRLTVIQEIAAAQVIFIKAMTDADKLKKASITEIGNAFETVTKNGLLMAGQATSITGTTGGDPGEKLTPEQMEQAAKIRERFAQTTDST